MGLYLAHCVLCHGAAAVSATHAPDLRRSPVPFSAEAFGAVVRDGVLRDNGMAGFSELTASQIEDIRHYIRTATHDARAAQARKP
jgi:quinohemoprotein ethanol dehydrogenase